MNDHLGNVSTVINDVKNVDDVITPGIIDNSDVFYPTVESFTDYLPFGQLMPGRNVFANETRYGFNGQEKDNEIAGNGNIYTAPFWEYDARIGRRWNVDPVVKVHESPFAAFGNNPIWFTDFDGQDTSFASKAAGDFVNKFVDPNSADYNKDYADKVNELFNSPGCYNFEDITYDPNSGDKAGKTSQDASNPDQVNIQFIPGDGPYKNRPGVGIGPNNSLWEETFHAWDYSKGGLDLKDPTCYDEAEAWQFSAGAPGTRFTHKTYVPEEKRYYNDNTAMFRIKNASTMQVADWFLNGMGPVYDEKTKTQGYGVGWRGTLKGLYYDLPLGPKK